LVFIVPKRFNGQHSDINNSFTIVWGTTSVSKVTSTTSKSITPALELTTRFIGIAGSSNVALLSRINGNSIGVKSVDGASQSGVISYMISGEI